MKRQDFYFDLPEELIAQDPLEDRSSSRLLVLDKKTGATSHHIFREIKDYLKPGDCLVINDTKVIPARLMGVSGKTRSKSQLRGRSSERGSSGGCRGRKPSDPF